MSRQQPSGLTRYFRDLIRKTFSGKKKRPGSRTTRLHPKLESLEGRQLLASDLGAINGIVTLQGTEVAGATVNLYRDDGDGIFEPGAEASGPIARTTDVTGAYLFERLAAGDYWIEQPAQTVGTNELGLTVSPLITISALDAEGIPGTSIDDFDDVPDAVVTSTSGTVSQHFDHGPALGGERDMTVTLSSGTTAPSVSLTSAGNQLVFDSSIDAQGIFNIVYDGDDDDTTLPPSVTTMPSQDLTEGGLNSSIKIQAQADHAGATVRLRVYTSATNFSESALFTIPDNTGPEDFVFHFSQFTDAGGTGADFADVRALELVIDTNTDATDGLVTLLGAFAPTVFSQDFANEVDLSVTKTVNDDTPFVGQDVTFTITVTNSTDSAGATDIQITDQLPTGLTPVSSDASVGNFTGGVWTIDSLAPGAFATLEIVATVTVDTPLDNTAEITAVDQLDFDPSNDTDTVTVDAVVASADLSLTITPETATPAIGQDVTFTVTLTNGGPDTATGIVVTDVIPTGLTLQSSDAETGTTYASNTWTIPSLASGEDVTLTIVLRAANGNALTYSAQVTDSDQADPDSTPNDGAGDDFDSASIDAVATADLSLTITPPTATPALNGDTTFTVTLTNGGPDAATNVVVTDVIPTGLTLQSSTAQTGTTYASNTWTIPSLASGASVTLTIVLRATDDDPLAYSAQVTDSDQADPDSTPNDGAGDDFDSATIDVPTSADLSLTITPETATPAIGQDVTFTVTLTNDGPELATNVVVTDVIPTGLTLQSSTAQTGTTYASNTWTIPSLASGASVTLTIVLRAANGNALTYSAQVTDSDQTDADSTPNDGAGDDFDSASIDAVPTADLSLTITPPTAAPALNGDTTFTVTLTNGGPDTATNVVVTDVIPTGLTLQSSNAQTGTTYASNTWTIPSLASGASVTLTIVLRATNANPLTYSAQVTDSDQADPDSTPSDGAGDDFDSSTIDVPASADLSLAITPPSATPNVGQDATFTVTLTNGGPDTATNVVVTDVIPAGLSLQSSTAGSGTTYASNVWNIPSLASGASVTLILVLRPTVSTALTYTTQVTASGATDPDSTPNDNTGDDRATATIDAPNAAADLSVTQTASSNTPNFGSIVTFTITVANGGPDTATGVVVTDLLPTGLVFDSSTPSQGSYVAGTGVWTVGTINSGATATLTLRARVNTTAAVDNVAQVTASGVSDPDSTPNDNTGDDRDVETIDAPAAADLRLSKSVSGSIVNVGQQVTFRLTLTNDGPDQATGVSVTDQLPAGLTFVSSTASVGTYDSVTGVWTVGSLNNGASATLDIVATLATAGSKTNTAQVTASGVFDPDSTPNDNAGDDRATVTVGSTLLSKRRFLAR